MTGVVIPPGAARIEQLADYFSWLVETGHGKDLAYIDQRGLSFLQPKHHACLAVGIPPEGETHDSKAGRSFVRAVF